MTSRTSKFDMHIVGDNAFEYFQKLEELFKTEKKEMANSLMRTMVGTPFSEDDGFIAPMMSKWNPYLAWTGQMEKYWEGVVDGGITSLKALYTGMDIHKYYAGGVPKGIWSEFSTPETRGKAPRDRVLDRDYAFFQETGIDKKADPKGARHKGAIGMGVGISSIHLHRQAGEYMSKIIKLERGTHSYTGNRSVESMFK